MEDIIAQNTEKIKWTNHKKAANEMAVRLAGISSFPRNRANRMRECSGQIEIRYCPSCGKSHTIAGSKCRDRFCPMCNWRLSLQRYAQMQAVINELRPKMEQFNSKVALVTLTIRNVSVQQLRKTIAGMSKAWDGFRNTKAFKHCLGWARSVEVTYNPDKNTMHPHYHVLMIYDTPDINMQQEEKRILKAWKASNNLSYDPQVNVREAYSKTDRDSIAAAAGEAFSYSIRAKDTEMMPDGVLGRFAKEVSGLRFASYGGEVKKIRAKLKLSDELEEEDHRSGICECGSKMEELVLVWAAGGYRYLQREEAAG